MPDQGKPILYNTLMRWFVLTGMTGALLSLVISFIMTYHSIRDFTYTGLTSSRDQQVELIATGLRKGLKTSKA